MKIRDSKQVIQCKKHNKILEYIDLSISEKAVYKCLVCIQEVLQATQSKIFQNQKPIQNSKQNDIVLIKDVKIQLNNALSKQDKQSYKEYKLDNYNESVDMRMIKNIIFQSCFKNELIQNYTFTIETNVNSNMIQFYNKFIIYGTENGYLQVYSINKNKLLFNKRISLEGIVVLIKDIRRADYFFVSGYDGRIVECQLKNKAIIQNQLTSSSINSTHLIFNHQEEFKTIEVEENDIKIQNIHKNKYISNKFIDDKYIVDKFCDKNNVDNQNINSNKEQQILKEQKDYDHDIDDDDNINVKVYRIFKNQKQICRMISCMDGKYIAAGVGKKVVLWNILTGKIFNRLVGYHSSQVHGLESIINSKYIISISKGMINLFNISNQYNPLVTQFKFQHSNLCTRVKKINENEFLVLAFPKRIVFFKIIQEKKFITQTIILSNKISSQDNNCISQISPKLSQQNSSYDDDEDDIYNMGRQDNQFISLKTKKNIKHLPAGLQVNSEQNGQRNLQLSSIEYNIIKTGEITLIPEFAYNLNVFDNYIFNVNGDYLYSFLVDYNQHKDINSNLNLEEITNSNQSQLTLLQYNDERILTSILLENVTINSQTYKNVIVNMPRNLQIDADENQKPSINLCFFA